VAIQPLVTPEMITTQYAVSVILANQAEASDPETEKFHWNRRRANGRYWPASELRCAAGTMRKHPAQY
jgi:hypothetical protein